MQGTINLHEFPIAITPVTGLISSFDDLIAWDPQTSFEHKLTHSFYRYINMVKLGYFLPSKSRAKILIFTAN